MASSSEQSRVPRERATRKRASRAAAARTTPEQKLTKNTDTVAKARSPENKAEKVKSRSVEGATAGNRKAPTSLSAIRRRAQFRRKQFIITGVVLLVGVGASAAVGLTDQGQIDVQETIKARNERIRTNTADERDLINSTVEVPVQDTSAVRKADGGLVGRGTGGAVPKPKPKLEPVSTTTATSSLPTASSTDMTASSTEDGAEEMDSPQEDKASG